MTKNPKLAIAVLPFLNLSSNRDNDWLCDGIAVEITNALSRIPELSVTSQTSSFQFKNSKLGVDEIAKTLGVNTVLEGSVQRFGDQMRVTVQLINVEDDVQVWSDSWKRSVERVFEIQDEISLSVADRVREQFGHFFFSDQLATHSISNIHAFEYCQRARMLFNKWNPEDVNKAIGFYEKAIQIEPDLIEAHTGLADGYSFLAVAGFAPREIAWKKATEHLVKAEKIDSKDAALNYLLANRAFFTEANFAKAMSYTHVSLVSKPNYSESLQFMAFLYMLKSERDKAAEYLGYAQAIDPMNQETKFYRAYFLYRFGQWSEAEAVLNELLESNPANLPARITSIYNLLKQGEYLRAKQALEQIPPVMVSSDEVLGINGLIKALSDPDNVNDILDKLRKNAREESSFQADAYWYKINCITGDFDEAFEVLSKCFTTKSSVLLLACSDPLSENIQRDERFAEFQTKLFSEPTEKSIISKNSGLKYAETADEDIQLLLDFMQSEKPFLDPSISLRKLALQIQFQPNQLSWLINEKTGVNFNGFINRYRIEYFVELAKNPENHNISLLGLAFESGFSSKSVFNTAFKKEKGTTPMNFLKGD